MPLIRNGCLNVTVSRRDLVKLTILALARRRPIQSELNRFRAIRQLLLQIVCSRPRNTALDSAPEANRMTVRLLSPNSHDFLFKPRSAPFAPRSDRPGH